LFKLCSCGHKMSIQLRTVIYRNKIEIEHVPIYTCESCSKSEVIQAVKAELSELIRHLGHSPDKQQIYFSDQSELAYLMVLVSNKEYKQFPVDQILNERINELLDLLLLAHSLQDEPWVDDIRKRLAQLTKKTLSTYDFT
jgi:hypothetical protein